MALSVPRGQPTYRGRRASTFGLRVEFDISGMAEVSKRLVGESRTAREVLVKAHRDLGSTLQADIIDELKARIKERGRVQRSGALIAALGNPRSIVATVTGFTFGFLENAEGNVRLYYRGLDQGTSAHVGMGFDAFVSESGRFVPATRDREAQIDPRLVRFKERNPVTGPMREGESGTRKTRVRGKNKGDRFEDRRHPEIVIQKPIEPYNYFESGMERFHKGNFGKDFSDMIIGVYAGWFEYYKLDLYMRWFGKFGKVEPRAGEAYLQTVVGRDIGKGDSQWLSY